MKTKHLAALIRLEGSEVKLPVYRDGNQLVVVSATPLSAAHLAEVTAQLVPFWPTHQIIVRTQV